MRPENARVFLDVDDTALRGLAAKDYSREMVDSWAPLPIPDGDAERMRADPEGEWTVIAEIDGRVVGIGFLFAKTNELRACYVAGRAIGESGHGQT